MPKKKTTTKPKAKKIYFPCQYCGKGLLSQQGKSTHEKNCSLNPDRQQQSQQSIQQPQPPTITPQMQEKIKNQLDADKKAEKDFILQGLEDKKQQLVNEKRDFTPEEKIQFQQVLNYIQDQSADKQEIASYDTAEKKLKGKGKVIQAAEALDDIRPNKSLTIQEALALNIVEDTIQSRQMNRIYMQERIQKLNQEPRESSGSKFQEKILLQLIDNMGKSAGENDIEKFEKNYSAIKKMIDVVGEKSPATEGFQQLAGIAKSYAPIFEAFLSKKQGQQNPQPPQEIITENISPNASQSIIETDLIEEQGKPDYPAPVPERLTDQEILQLSKNMDLSDYGIDSSSDNNQVINQSLGLGSFARSSTSPSMT